MAEEQVPSSPVGAEGRPLVPTEETLIKLVSRGGDKVEVPVRKATLSELVETMMVGEQEGEEIPVPEVETATLIEVVEYMNRYEPGDPNDQSKPVPVRMPSPVAMTTTSRS